MHSCVFPVEGQGWVHTGRALGCILNTPQCVCRLCSNTCSERTTISSLYQHKALLIRGLYWDREINQLHNTFVHRHGSKERQRMAMLC